jgi:site-specific recombinase XerD
MQTKFASLLFLHRSKSRLLEAGVDHITIAAILGHTDLRMIQRYAQSSKAKRSNRSTNKIVPKPENEKALTTVSA